MAQAGEADRTSAPGLTRLLGLSFAGVTLGAGSLVLAAVSGAAPALLPYAGVTVYAHEAQQILDSQAPDRIGRAEKATQQELRHAPLSKEGWLRLIYIDLLKHPRLSGEGVRALRSVYAIAPLDPDGGSWRMTVALNNWDQIDPALQARVREELGVILPNMDPDSYQEFTSGLRTDVGRREAEQARLHATKRERS